MGSTGPLKYGLHPTVRLANNITPFAAVFTLKPDDPDGHAKAIAGMIGEKDLEQPLRKILAHFDGAPGDDASFTNLLEFIAAHQVEVIAYFCA